MKTKGGLFTSGVGIIHPPNIILGQTPLPEIVLIRLGFRRSTRQAYAMRSPAGVDPIIDVPNQATFLMFKIPSFSDGWTLVDELLFIGHAIAFGIAITHQLIRIGFGDQHLTIQRQNQAW